MTYLDQLPDIVEFIFPITVVLPLKKTLFLFHTTLWVYGYMTETITVVLTSKKTRNTHMFTITVVFTIEKTLFLFHTTLWVYIFMKHTITVAFTSRKNT